MKWSAEKSNCHTSQVSVTGIALKMLLFKVISEKLTQSQYIYVLCILLFD